MDGLCLLFSLSVFCDFVSTIAKYLARKTRLWYHVLRVEWDSKLYALTVSPVCCDCLMLYVVVSLEPERQRVRS